jgi:hypothetical protein
MTTLTIYFADPWWVGVVEIEEQGRLRAYRHLFGAEPTDGDVLELILRDFDRLTGRPAVEVELGKGAILARNPKRLARESARAAAAHGISTKAQESLKLSLEAKKKERRKESREERLRAAEEKRRKAAEKRRKAAEKALARRRGR